jgi:F420H(2)-dependent quinone reductase
VRKRPRHLDSPVVPKVIRVMSKANVWVYRRTRGRIGGKWRVGSAFPWGVPVCLLTTRGRVSGKTRTTPLLYIAEGESIVLVASQGGLPTDPHWYRNIASDPDVVVDVRGDRRRMRARTADDAERARLWPRLVAHYRDFATYQSWTERLIPVVICDPIPGGPYVD